MPGVAVVVAAAGSSFIRLVRGVASSSAGCAVGNSVGAARTGVADARGWPGTISFCCTMITEPKAPGASSRSGGAVTGEVDDDVAGPGSLDGVNTADTADLRLDVDQGVNLATRPAASVPRGPAFFRRRPQRHDGRTHCRWRGAGRPSGAR